MWSLRPKRFFRPRIVVQMWKRFSWAHCVIHSLPFSVYLPLSSANYTISPSSKKCLIVAILCYCQAQFDTWFPTAFNCVLCHIGCWSSYSKVLAELFLITWQLYNAIIQLCGRERMIPQWGWIYCFFSSGTRSANPNSVLTTDKNKSGIICKIV